MIIIKTGQRWNNGRVIRGSVSGGGRGFGTSNGRTSREFLIDIVFRHGHVEPPKPGEE